MDTLEKDYDCDFKVMMVESTWLQHNLNESPQLCVLKKGFLFPSLMKKHWTFWIAKPPGRMNSILRWFYVKEIVSRNYKSNLKLPAQSPTSVHFEESPIFPFNFVECLSSWFILPYLPDGGNIFQLLSAHKVSFLYPEPRIHPCILCRHITHYTSRPR